MKKLLFIILFAITGLCLFAGEKKIPERPLNIPEEAKWYSFYWYYACPELGSYYLRWYPDGKLMTLFYKLEGTEYRVFEDYHKNGKIKKQEILCTLIVYGIKT